MESPFSDVPTPRWSWCALTTTTGALSADARPRTIPATFRETILRHTMLHEDMRKFYGGFPRDAHPMAILSGAVSALSTFYQDSLDPADPRQVEISIHRLLAKLPTIAAYSYKKSIGQPFVYPQNDLTYCANFLQMMFAVPCEPYEVDPDAVAALQALFNQTLQRVLAGSADQFGDRPAKLAAFPLFQDAALGIFEKMRSQIIVHQLKASGDIGFKRKAG